MRRTFLAALTALALVGCGNGIDTASTTEKPGAYVRFDSNTGTFAYPNNILFAGSDDGTLNIPFEPTDADAALKAQLNSLDGFSTTSPITLPLSAEVNASTLPGNVRLFKVIAAASAQTYGIPAVGATEKELIYGVDFVTAVSGSKIAVLPLKPLAGHSNYMVVVTDGVRAANGGTLSPDSTTAMLNSTNALIDENNNSTVYFDPNAAVNNATAQQLELLRRLTQLMFAQAGANGIEAAHIVTAWSFQTQTIGTVAKAISDANLSGTLGLQDSGFTSSQMLGMAGEDNSSFFGIAEVYAGTLSNLPYLLDAATTPYDTAPLTTTFTYAEGSTMPIVRDNRTIPVLATIPKTSAIPADGWPVVIFQHGITQNRTNLLAIAEAFANAGYAAVAIDLPLHGIDDNSSALFMQPYERTFNLDLVNNDTGVSGPDGKIDPSGTHFINLLSLATSCDTMRQNTADLVALSNALHAPAVAEDGLKFDTAHIALVGHSFGAMTSFGYLANRNPESVTLAMPGGGIAELLNNSATFGPRIEAGLAAVGIIKGTEAYDSFVLAAQTIVEDADPVNYAASLGEKPLFVIEARNDGVIPNSISTAPLSGTEPLLGLVGATDINLSSAPGTIVLGSNTVSLFAEPAGHASLLDPTDSLDATVEMQTEVASFVHTTGQAITVGDPSLIISH